MSFDLTNKNISDTYQNLLQKTGSNNQLFDLLGNPVTDLTIQGALIAESYIVSQSSTIHSSGSTAFGNTTDDTHTFIGDINTTGHITASGNISASGDIFSNHINVDGGISSSGDMNFVAPNSNIYHFNKGDKAADFKFSCAGGETFFISGGVLGQVGLGTNTPTTKLQVAGTTTTTNLISTSHITASGNISASDDIKGKNFLGKIGSFGVGISNQPDPTIPSNNDIQLFVTRNGSTAQALIERVGNGELLLTAGASDVEVGTRNNYPLHLIHNNTDRVKIDAGGIDVIGHITASENISASGDIIATGTGSFSDGRFSGFVGIGNGGSAIAPEALLHLQNTEDDKYLQRWTLNNIEGGIFGDASGDVLKIQVNSNDALAFTTNATERVRIAKDGGT